MGRAVTVMYPYVHFGSHCVDLILADSPKPEYHGAAVRSAYIVICMYLADRPMSHAHTRTTIILLPHIMELDSAAPQPLAYMDMVEMVPGGQRCSHRHRKTESHTIFLVCHFLIQHGTHQVTLFVLRGSFRSGNGNPRAESHSYPLIICIFCTHYTYVLMDGKRGKSYWRISQGLRAYALLYFWLAMQQGTPYNHNNEIEIATGGG